MSISITILSCKNLHYSYPISIQTKIWKQIRYQQYPSVFDPFTSLIDLIICLVGSLWVLDKKKLAGILCKRTIQPDPIHLHGRVGSGWPAILCVIFGLDQVFSVPGQIFRPVPDPSLGRVGSGFFWVGWVKFIGSGGPWSGLLEHAGSSVSWTHTLPNLAT